MKCVYLLYIGKDEQLAGIYENGEDARKAAADFLTYWLDGETSEDILKDIWAEFNQYPDLPEVVEVLKVTAKPLNQIFSECIERYLRGIN